MVRHSYGANDSSKRVYKTQVTLTFVHLVGFLAKFGGITSHHMNRECIYYHLLKWPSVCLVSYSSPCWSSVQGESFMRSNPEVRA